MHREVENTKNVGQGRTVLKCLNKGWQRETSRLGVGWSVVIFVLAPVQLSIKEERDEQDI